MMKSELIRHLEENYPEDIEIFVDGYEGDYTPLVPENIRKVRLQHKGYHSDYFGDYQGTYPSDELLPQEHPIFDAVVLGRQ